MTFAEHMSEQRPALMRFATVLTGQTWLAEDLVSDVLDRTFERWNHISQLDHPHAYVRRMLVNGHLSWRRRRQQGPPHEGPSPLGGHVVSVPDVADAVTERDAMIARLDRLPRRQRAAVVLRFYAGLTDDGIARELGCQASTVRSQISRALQNLLGARRDTAAKVQVYVIGGATAVSQAAVDEITAVAGNRAPDAAGVSVRRVGGADRYATAAAVATEPGTRQSVRTRPASVRTPPGPCS